MNRTAIAAAIGALALVTVLGFTLVLMQTIAVRGDLDAARTDVAELESHVAAMERGVPVSELSLRLGELENEIRGWVVAFADDVPPAGGTEDIGAGITDETLERLDDILDEINALNERLDEICEGVPVC